MIALPRRTHALTHTWRFALALAAVSQIIFVGVFSCNTSESESTSVGALESIIRWQTGGADDSVFGTAADVIADVARDRVLIADPAKSAIIELNALTGRPEHYHRATGTEEGDKWLSPEQVAVSPNGEIVAVYDAGRQAVDVLDDQFAFVRRIPIQVILISVKALVVFDDTTVVLSGGRARGGSGQLGTHWLVNGYGPLASDYPERREGSLTSVDGNTYMARQLVKGGPLRIEDPSCVMFADAVSGNVWRCCRNGAQKVADGPPTMVAKSHNIVQRVLTDGPDGVRVWWTFPKVVMLEPYPGGGFLEAVSSPDDSVATFYRVDPQHGVKTIASLNRRVRAIIAYGNTSFVAIVEPIPRQYSVLRIDFSVTTFDSGL